MLKRAFVVYYPLDRSVSGELERECDMNWRNLACRAIALQTLRRDHNNSINGRSKMLMSTMLASTR